MSFSPLTAVSPIDGRYYSKTKELSTFFSEYALIKYRIHIEIEYFIALCNHPLPQLKAVPKDIAEGLRDIVSNFSIADAQRIKEIEKVTNHDVKAVEYFIKEKFDKKGLEQYKEFIHFALTSQDINNTSIPLSLKEGIQTVFLPELAHIIQKLQTLAKEWEGIPMLARTHGQPASPTTLGKEIKVFVERLLNQRAQLEVIPFSAKFGGATGNFNAHHVTYPDIDWIAFGNHFVNDILGLSRSQYTTQIEHYDNLASIFHAMIRINNILIDLSRDVWTYISMDYFKQKVIAGEVGSSAMPHKVNPIDFENAEGNFGVANAIFEHLSSKLPISRLQRDLTDSTVLRNIGVPIGHTVIGFQSVIKGLNKLLLNTFALEKDLENSWMVVAEAIQNILRREGYPQPYEALKTLTRGKAVVSQKDIHDFIDSLAIAENIRHELKGITPQNYVGIVK